MMQIDEYHDLSNLMSCEEVDDSYDYHDFSNLIPSKDYDEYNNNNNNNKKEKSRNLPLNDNITSYFERICAILEKVECFKNIINNYEKCNLLRNDTLGIV